jgi:2-phosphoglycolate phosphatase
LNTRDKLDAGGFEAVLFDLDGTLADTAPDMVGALQEMQRDKGYSPVPYEQGRSTVSNGALGLLKLGFPDIGDPVRTGLMSEFIERYKSNLCVKTTVFAGIDTLLNELDAANLAWGVVTNKPAHLTEPLMRSLQLANRCACIVSGDTLATRKPAPEPMLHACELAGVRPQHTIYVGDAARDIEAGCAAGMATIAATYGYIMDGDDPAEWNANGMAASTQELAKIVAKAVNLVI